VAKEPSEKAGGGATEAEFHFVKQTRWFDHYERNSEGLRGSQRATGVMGNIYVGLEVFGPVPPEKIRIAIVRAGDNVLLPHPAARYKEE